MSRIARATLWLQCILLTGCASLQGAQGSGQNAEELVETLLLALPERSALHLVGSVDGPLGGLGPSLDFDAWFTGAELRADLRYEVEGRARHEVLLWTRSSILLFDRDRGGMTELGDGPLMTSWGGSFSLGSLHWLCLGSWPKGMAPPRFVRDGRDWSGQDEELELFGRGVDRSGHLSRTSVRWRDQAGVERELSALLEAQIPFLAGRIPQRVRLDGDDLDMELHISLRAQIVENVEDSVFDPLRDP